MLCEMGGEVRRYSMILVKLVVTESLGDHTQMIQNKTNF